MQVNTLILSFISTIMHTRWFFPQYMYMYIAINIMILWSSLVGSHREGKSWRIGIMMIKELLSYFHKALGRQGCGSWLDISLFYKSTCIDYAKLTREYTSSYLSSTSRRRRDLIACNLSESGTHVCAVIRMYICTWQAFNSLLMHISQAKVRTEIWEINSFKCW